ncbi:hypothetical protein, partial [Rahnella inusitata]|uniref:hypothetical protein n=1 Tax=Rahnella inusitata TaxID=58169 RepID=UPI001B7D71DC
PLGHPSATKRTINSADPLVKPDPVQLPEKQAFKSQMTIYASLRRFCRQESAPCPVRRGKEG